MKKNKANHYLMWIPILNLFIYVLHTSAMLPDVILGTLMGIGIGLSVLIIYLAHNNYKKVKSIKENIKNKLL